MSAPTNGDRRAPAASAAAPRVSRLERALAFLAPGAARARYDARLRLWSAEREALRYEAADVGRRTGEWRPQGTSANVETASSLRHLRNRSRALGRDRGWGRRVVELWTAFLVGSGWEPIFDDGDAREEPWQDWAGAGSTECDATAQHEFFALVRVAVRCWLESGSALVVRRWNRTKALPVEFAVYEPDYLDWGRDGRAQDGATVVQGVQFDAAGRLEGYWLLPEHPGGQVATGYQPGALAPSSFFPAADVAHLYLYDRPGQVSGVPIMHAILLSLHDWTDMTDAKLLQQKNAAAFGWVERDLSTDPPAGPLPDETTRPRRHVEPGSILTADAGRTIEPMPTPDPGPFEELASEFLHELAGGVDLPFSLFSGHLKEMSFSTARSALIPLLRVMDGKIRGALLPRLLRPAFRWFAQGARLRGLPGFDDRRAHLVDWNPPPVPQLDPVLENQADLESVRAGFKTFSAVVRGRGLHRTRHLESLRSERDQIDALELVLDGDGRKFGPAGASPGYEVAKQQADAQATTADAAVPAAPAAPKK